MHSFLALAATAFLTAPPSAVTVQGRLTTTDGGVAQGPTALTLHLFHAGDEVPFWKQTLPDVPVSQGLFSVQLTDIPPFELLIGAAELQIQVGDDPALPAVPLTSVPYAHVSHVSVHAESATTLSAPCDVGEVLKNIGAVWVCAADATRTAGSGLSSDGAALILDTEFGDARWVNLGQAGAITGVMIAAGSIGSEHLAIGAVNDQHVGAISLSKLTGGQAPSGTYTFPSDAIVNANGPWLMTACPQLFLLKMTNLCVSGFVRGPETLLDAEMDCMSIGGHVCTYAEYHAALKTGIGLPPSLTPGHWLGDRLSETHVMCIGGAQIPSNFGDTCSQTQSNFYRCCIGRGR